MSCETRSLEDDSRLQHKHSSLYITSATEINVTFPDDVIKCGRVGQRSTMLVLGAERAHVSCVAETGNRSRLIQFKLLSRPGAAFWRIKTITRLYRACENIHSLHQTYFIIRILEYLHHFAVPVEAGTKMFQLYTVIVPTELTSDFHVTNFPIEVIVSIPELSS